MRDDLVRQSQLLSLFQKNTGLRFLYVSGHPLVRPRLNQFLDGDGLLLDAVAEIADSLAGVNNHLHVMLEDVQTAKVAG